MRREERVTVQGPAKEQQPDGMSHRGASQRAVSNPPPPGVGNPPSPALLGLADPVVLQEATKKYKAIADKAGISLATLSLSWCMSRWYVASTIIGATTMDQLKEDIDAFTVTLTEDELKAIDKVHMEHKDPTVGL